MKKIYSKNYKKDIIPGGLADNIPSSEFDKNYLQEGIKVELEHTSDKDIAEEIVKDHLTEDKKYYKKLKKIEKEALLNDSEKNILNNNMLDVIEEFESGPFLLYLLKASSEIYPKGLKYQIAIQSEGLSATNITDQFSKNLNFKALKSINSIIPIKNKIREWINSYGEIGISSMNNEKTSKWFNILKFLGFTVTHKKSELMGIPIEYVELK
jgi:hypothetical protein